MESQKMLKNKFEHQNKFLDQMHKEFRDIGIKTNYRSIIELTKEETGEKFYTYYTEKK